MDSRRFYRETLQPKGLTPFTVRVKETDLWVAVDEKSFSPDLPQRVEELVWWQHQLLEDYMKKDPLFRETFSPYLLAAGAPPLALEMVRAGNRAGVGPMAAVAGAFAQLVGKFLLQSCQQVLVENGGDIFLKMKRPTRLGIYAGKSPFTGKLALEVPARRSPWGICTSSGTVGPSYSEGRADAAVILSASAPLADAVATAAANRVKGPEDLNPALDFARGIRGVEGVLLIYRDKLAAWGQVKLLPAGS